MTLENHSGRTSGKPYVRPMMYLEGDGVRYTFASKAGVPTHPDRYYNLFSGKAAAVQVGTKTYATLASKVTGAKRTRSTPSKPPATRLAEYEVKTKGIRTIPVLALARTWQAPCPKNWPAHTRRKSSLP